MKQKEINKNISLVLSGGGARGFAHLGVLQYLLEQGFIINRLSGTSAGAIVAAFFAAGNSPQEILEFLKKSKAFSVKNFSVMSNGFFNLSSLKILLEKYATTNFEELNIPIYVTATNISLGQSETFSSGYLHEKVMASACVPVVFNPIEINGNLYVDGGVMCNFPLHAVEEFDDPIIGVHVGKITKEINSNSGKINVAIRSLNLAISNQAHFHKSKCDIYIEPEFTSTNMFTFNKGDEIYELGYNTAKKQLEKKFILV